MPTDFLKLLTDLGLSPTETRVYLASLKLGPTSVQEIAKKAKLSRTASYDVIASLQERGLMSTFERGKKKYFAAEEPERAVSYFRRRVHDLEDQIEMFSRSLDEMKMLTGGERPVVRFFEGREALFSLFSDLSSANAKELLELANVDLVYEKLDPEILAEARKAFGTAKTKVRMLHSGELRNPAKNAEFCRLLPEFGEIGGEIWIYGDRVAFSQWVGKMVVVIVQSTVFSDMARTLFNAAWAVCTAQPYKKK